MASNSAAWQRAASGRLRLGRETEREIRKGKIKGPALRAVNRLSAHGVEQHSRVFASAGDLTSGLFPQGISHLQHASVRYSVEGHAMAEGDDDRFRPKLGRNRAKDGPAA